MGKTSLELIKCMREKSTETVKIRKIFRGIDKNDLFSSNESIILPNGKNPQASPISSPIYINVDTNAAIVVANANLSFFSLLLQQLEQVLPYNKDLYGAKEYFAKVLKSVYVSFVFKCFKLQSQLTF